MTIHGVDGRERHSGRYAPLENAGILRCAQNDDVKLTRAKTRTGWENVYIPTLATIKPSRRCGTRAYFGWFRRDNDNSNKRQRQQQQTTTTTTVTNNNNGGCGWVIAPGLVRSLAWRLSRGGSGVR